MARINTAIGTYWDSVVRAIDVASAVPARDSANVPRETAQPARMISAGVEAVKTR